MRILSWNIQNGKGCDDQVSLMRIVREIEAMGEPDVICLQEVARFNPELDGGACHDQLQELAEYFPGSFRKAVG